MRVCFCTPQIPYPPVSGGHIETQRLVEGLSDVGHEVTVVTYTQEDDEVTAFEDATGCEVVPVQDVRSWSATQYLANVASADPLPVDRTRSPDLVDAVESAVRDENPDVIHLHTLQLSFLAQEFDVPTVIRFTNAKSKIYDQFAERTRNPAKAAYARYQGWKTRRYEADISTAADRTLAITDSDREIFEANGAIGVETLPAGIDINRFTTDEDRPNASTSDSPVITFFASMDYYPNEDAAVWLGEKIFPRIRESYPDARLDLVGKSPPDSVERLGEKPGIRVTGFVDDIFEYVAEATVVAVPIRVGTGVRIKILHALAMGKPVVSTPTGIQGIPVEDGFEALVRADNGPFADAVISLLDDPDRRASIANRGQQFVRSKFDQAVVAERLGSIYRDIVDDHSVDADTTAKSRTGRGSS